MRTICFAGKSMLSFGCQAKPFSALAGCSGAERPILRTRVQAENQDIMGQPHSFPLQAELERFVQDRTGRRVHDLAVEVCPEGVVIRGRTSTYYVKQLAQHGIREVLPDVSLENAIVVG